MPLFFGRANSSAIPTAVSNGTSQTVRTDAQGAVHNRNEILAWAEEGSYFRALGNATPGTGVAMGIQTSFSATANVLLAMVNGSSTTRVIPHYIRLICTAAGATTTSSNLAIAIDNVNRYSSGGTDISGLIVNSNSALGPSSALTVLRFGTLTATAAGAGTRYVSQTVLKTQVAPCWTVGDEVRLNFAVSGDADPQPLSGSAPLGISKNFGPVVLGGLNSSLLIHMWNPANATTPPSWALELAWWER